MISKKFFLAYFFFLGLFFGFFDFIYDREDKKFKTSKFLVIYSKCICLLFLSSFPLFIYTIIYKLVILQKYPTMLLIMWTIEYCSLFLMTGVAFYIAVTRKKSIQNLINEGIVLYKSIRHDNIKVQLKEEENKKLKFFVFKFIIDHIVLLLNITFLQSDSTLSIEGRILTMICFTMNVISYFITNAFVYLLTLVLVEVEKINYNIAVNIGRDNHLLSFARNVQAHRRARLYCEKVVKMFSKICITNLLYAFTTTLSGVRDGVEVDSN
jgi:hypothetical protein